MPYPTGFIYLRKTLTKPKPSSRTSVPCRPPHKTLLEIKRQQEQKKEGQARGRTREQLCWRGEKGRREYHFINLWQKREQTLTLAQGFLKARELTLLHDRPRTSAAKSPSDSHAWRKPTERAGHVGSSTFSGQTFIPRGRSLPSSSARFSGSSGLLQPLLRRARSRCCSKAKTHGSCRRARATSGAASSNGARWVLQSHPEKHRRSLMRRSLLSQLDCYQPELAGFY